MTFKNRVKVGQRARCRIAARLHYWRLIVWLLIPYPGLIARIVDGGASGVASRTHNTQGSRDGGNRRAGPPDPRINTPPTAWTCSKSARLSAAGRICCRVSPAQVAPLTADNHRCGWTVDHNHIQIVWPAAHDHDAKNQRRRAKDASIPKKFAKGPHVTQWRHLHCARFCGPRILAAPAAP